MLDRFIQFGAKHKLFNKDKTTLIALSGGVDSVVLCHLFQKANFPFTIAHCNFKLRGKDSDEDEKFCKSLAEFYQALFYTTSWQTAEVASSAKESIQLTARKLRYQWLNRLVDETPFTYLATAHHLNDVIETFLYNFTKGTGIRGLRSIEPKNKYLVRPLLFATKEEIIEYAKINNLSFREDASNASVKYNRNKIRHNVIPVLKSINPNLEKTALTTFQNLREIEALYNWSIEQQKTFLVSQKSDNLSVNLSELFTTIAPTTLLYEIIRPYGFTGEQVSQIISKKTRESGARFYSKTYILLVNRGELIISEIEKETDQSYFIESELTSVSVGNGILSFSKETKLPTTFSSDKNVALLDFDKLTFPLKLRHWKEGDSFQPLGMDGQHKKLKKLFTDNKLTILEKDKIWLLESGKIICWILGHQIDDRFKITSKTKICLKAEWVPSGEDLKPSPDGVVAD